MSEHTADYDAGRRRTKAEARRCSQEGCPGDGRYQPPGRGHLPNCQHNAMIWVWETVAPPGEGRT